MKFVLKMAVRETRAAWRRLLFFFLCIAVGVGAIAALRSAIQNVRGVLTSQARTLIGGDLVVSTAQAWSPEVRTGIDRRLGAAGVSDTTESIETATMVRPEDPARAVAKMVELRAVQPGFPLYGGSSSPEGGPTRMPSCAITAHSSGPNCSPASASRVGERPAHRRPVVHDPRRHRERAGRGAWAGSASGRACSSTTTRSRRPGLLTFGSRARYVLMARVGEAGLDALVATLRNDLRNQFVHRALVPHDRRRHRPGPPAGRELPQSGRPRRRHPRRHRRFERHPRVRDQKLKSIAVLKCVGAGTWRVIAVYVLQVVALGLGGSLMGLVLGRAALEAVPDRLGSAPSSFALPHALTAAGGHSGRGHRRAGVAAVLAGAAAQGAPRQAFAAAQAGR